MTGSLSSLLAGGGSLLSAFAFSTLEKKLRATSNRSAKLLSGQKLLSSGICFPVAKLFKWHRI
jgi:hypothetical protein